MAHQSDKIIFLHIHKTAGTSLRTALRNRLGDNFLPWYPGNKSAEQARSELREHFQLIYGHLEFGAHEALGIEPRYATILREPVSRVISYYNYIKEQRPDHPYHDALQKGMSLGEFVSSPDVLYVRNHMVRVISGFQRDPEADLEVDFEVWRQARANLIQHFVYIGVVETLARDINGLARLCGLRRIPLKQINVGSYDRTKPTAADIEAVRKHNAYDLRLYRLITRVRERVSLRNRATSRAQGER